MTVLPDFLTTETWSAILERMLAEVPDDIDKSEGSYIYDALAAAATELAQMKIDMGNFLARGFASTTFGEYLDLRGEEHGLTRREAVAATGQVTFTGTVGITIPEGTIVATPADPMLSVAAIEFVTNAEATIPEGGTVDIDIEASVAGESGNVLAGTITVLASSVSGITAVTNASATSGGEEEEMDSALLSRYRAKVQDPGTSGNKADYQNWALEVPGVGDVQVIPIWDGNGTVKVVLVDEDKLSADPAVVTAVQNYIAPDPEMGEGKAPIGATVTVVAATAVDIDVSATVTLNGAKTLSEVQTAFEAALTEYLKSIAFADDPKVKYVKIGSLLLDVPGVSDYSSLLVNSGTSNINIENDEVAVKGTVSLTE